MQDTDITSFGKGKLSTYIIGFVLSLILTVIPFYLVMTSEVRGEAIVVTIVFFAVLQAIVHLVCFLQMRFTTAQFWDWQVFIYTLILLFILVGASLWIMYHLNLHMMS